MAKIMVSTKVGMEVEFLNWDKPVSEIVKLLEDNGATLVKLKEEE